MDIKYNLDFEDCKELGSFIVAAGERVPATGWDGTPDGPLIPRGTRNAVVMHVAGIIAVQRARFDLTQAACYVARHEVLRERLWTVGVTYSRMARLAVRAGFRQLHPYVVEEEYEALLRADNARYAPKDSYKPAMVYLPTEEFIDRFATT